jgi:hypothetical protein
VITSLILGIVFLSLVGARLLVRPRGAVPGLLLIFAAVWGIALLNLAALSSRLEYSSPGLLVTVGPLALVMCLAWPALLQTGPRERAAPDPVTESFFWVALASGVVVVLFDVTRTLAFVREGEPHLALAAARTSRQAGSFYPPLVMPLNSLRLFLAPLAWTLLATGATGARKHAARAGLVIGLVSLLLTTGRAPFVLTLAWLMGISYWHRATDWGLRGIAVRLGAIVAAGSVFFVGYGLALGKTYRVMAEHIRGGESASPLMSGVVSLLVYAVGPIAALANSAEAALSEAFRVNLVYPAIRAAQLLGAAVGEPSRSLPYVNIPFPLNTYTFLGPAYWYGGLAACVGYLCVVLGALVWLERSAPRRVATTPVLFGFFFAAIPMSLSSDYFLSAGFAYLLYAYALVAFAFQRTRSR